jgi:hypothetical protein
MCSQSTGIGSANISASMWGYIRTIPALLHCASHIRDNVKIVGAVRFHSSLMTHHASLQFVAAVPVQ